MDNILRVINTVVAVRDLREMCSQPDRWKIAIKRKKKKRQEATALNYCKGNSD